MQQSILIGFLNQKYNDPNLIIAIGSGMTQLSLVFYPIFFGIITTYTIIGSSAYGAKKHYLLGTHLNRCKFYAYSIAIILAIVYLASNRFVGNLLKLNPVAQSYTFTYLWMRLISLFFEFEFVFLITYIQIIGKGYLGAAVLVISSLLFPLYCYLFIIVANLSFYGPGLTIIVFNISMAFIFWVFIHILGKNKDHILFFNMDIFNEFLYIVKISAPLYLMNLLDNLSYESMSIFANYQAKDDYNGYIIVSSVLSIMATIANGFMVVTNVSISNLMGRNLYERAKTLSLYILINANLIGLVLYIPVVCLKPQIIHLLTPIGPIFNIANDIYFEMLFCIFTEISCSIFFGIFVSVGRFYLALLLFAIFSGVNILSIYLFLNVFNVGIGGVFLGAAISRLIMLIVYSLIYTFVIDWKECAEAMKIEIEKGAEIANKEIEKSKET